MNNLKQLNYEMNTLSARVSGINTALEQLLQHLQGTNRISTDSGKSTSEVGPQGILPEMDHTLVVIINGITKIEENMHVLMDIAGIYDAAAKGHR